MYSKFLSQQIRNILPYFDINDAKLKKYEDRAISKTEILLSHLAVRDSNYFNIKVTWHLATFIYWLSREIWENEGSNDECEALFCLNKILNAIDLFYEVPMPNIFFLGGHTSGQVFVKASFEDYLVTFQNCTIGRNLGDTPILGRYNVLYPGSSIIGNCVIGNNVVLGPGVQIVNRKIQDNTILKLNAKNGLEEYKLHDIHALRFFGTK